MPALINISLAQRSWQ